MHFGSVWLLIVILQRKFAIVLGLDGLVFRMVPVNGEDEARALASKVINHILNSKSAFQLLISVRKNYWHPLTQRRRVISCNTDSMFTGSRIYLAGSYSICLYC